MNLILNGLTKHTGESQTGFFIRMTSPVAGAVRIMPAVGHGVPGTSTGVIETDSALTQHSVRHSG